VFLPFFFFKKGSNYRETPFIKDGPERERNPFHRIATGQINLNEVKISENSPLAALRCNKLPLDKIVKVWYNKEYI
jgi:hypothetical protein